MTTGQQNFVIKLTQVLVLVGVILGAFLTMEARIASAVAKEEVERKEGDLRVERSLVEIKDELRDLNSYLRDNPRR